MASNVDVANMALARLGILEPITALTDDSASARAITGFLATARQRVLESYAWGHASTEVALDVVANATRSGWVFVYDLPADLLVPRYLYPGARPAQLREEESVPFELGYDPDGARTDGRVLFTDLEDAVLFYTRDEDDPALWPVHFTDAVAWRLAAEIALPLQVESQRAGLAWQLANNALAAAMAVEARGERLDPDPEPSFLAVRR